MGAKEIASLEDQFPTRCQFCGEEIGPVICCLSMFLLAEYYWEAEEAKAERLIGAPPNKPANLPLSKTRHA